MAQGRKLLVIDSDPAIFRYLRRGLARKGYEVAEAQVENVLARIDEWPPDAVLLDSARQIAGPDDHGPIVGTIDRLDAD